MNTFAIAIACAWLCVGAGTAVASDASDAQAVVAKWVADFNKGDFESFVAACAPNAAVVDGFPPYAWQTCFEWISDYQSNNEVLGATHGMLEIGAPLYEELKGNHAYLIYPATFTDTQEGKEVVYQGTWTMTLEKTESSWVFTGSASAWGVNSL